MTNTADEHRATAALFTDRVRNVKPEDWDNPAPPAGWVARDVVRHLIEWFPAMLRAGAGIDLPTGPSVDDDPLAAWTAHTDAVQAMLDDPATAGKLLRDPNIGELPVERATAMLYTPDIFMHSWDLARATGQDERLDQARCAALLEGLLPMDEALRASGQFGPKVPVAADADPQTRLLAFIGRQVGTPPSGAASR